MATENHSCSLDGLERRQLRSKHLVPEPACDSEAVLVVREVMLEVVLLQGAVVGWKSESRKSVLALNARETDEKYSLAVMKEVVSQVIAHISENSSRVRRHSCIPVVKKQSVCELIEGRSE